MRIRTIKPEFWQSENMAGASRDARLVAIALLNYADDEGIFLANERVFKGALFPFDNDLDVRGAFQELSNNGFVAFVEHSGKTLGKILNFRLHQRIDKPQKSRFHAENVVFGDIPRTLQEDSTNIPRTFQESSMTEVEREVEREVEEGSGSRKGKKERASRSGPLIPSFDDFAAWAESEHPDWSREASAWYRQMASQDWITTSGRPVLNAKGTFNTWLREGWIKRIPPPAPRRELVGC